MPCSVKFAILHADSSSSYVLCVTRDGSGMRYGQPAIARTKRGILCGHSATVNGASTFGVKETSREREGHGTARQRSVDALMGKATRCVVFAQISVDFKAALPLDAPILDVFRIQWAQQSKFADAS